MLVGKELGLIERNLLNYENSSPKELHTWHHTSSGPRETPTECEADQMRSRENSRTQKMRCPFVSLICNIIFNYETKLFWKCLAYSAKSTNILLKKPNNCKLMCDSQWDENIPPIRRLNKPFKKQVDYQTKMCVKNNNNSQSSRFVCRSLALVWKCSSIN